MIGERPDLEGRARVRRLEAGVHADLLQRLPQPAIGNGQGYRLGAGHIRQLGEGIPVRDVGVGAGFRPCGIGAYHFDSLHAAGT